MDGVQSKIVVNRSKIPEPFIQIPAYGGNASMIFEMTKKTKKDRFPSRNFSEDDSQMPQTSRFQRDENSQAPNQSQNFVQMNSDAGRDYANRDYANRNFQYASRNVQRNVVTNSTPHDIFTCAVARSVSQRFLCNIRIANVEEEKYADEIGNANGNDVEDSEVIDGDGLNYHLASINLSIG